MSNNVKAREVHVNSIKAAPVPFCSVLFQLFAIILTIVLIISKLETAIYMHIRCSQYSGSIQEHIQIKRVIRHYQSSLTKRRTSADSFFLISPRNVCKPSCLHRRTKLITQIINLLDNIRSFVRPNAVCNTKIATNLKIITIITIITIIYILEIIKISMNIT